MRFAQSTRKEDLSFNVPINTIEEGYTADQASCKL